MYDSALIMVKYLRKGMVLSALVLISFTLLLSVFYLQDYKSERRAVPTTDVRFWDGQHVIGNEMSVSEEEEEEEDTSDLLGNGDNEEDEDNENSLTVGKEGNEATEGEKDEVGLTQKTTKEEEEEEDEKEVDEEEEEEEEDKDDERDSALRRLKSELARKRQVFAQSKSKSKDHDETEEEEDEEDEESDDEEEEEEEKEEAKTKYFKADKDEDAMLISNYSKVTPVPFNMQGSDVLVYLHIQKTGGTTFEYHLVQDLITDPVCKCVEIWKRHLREHCDCLNRNGQIWLFNRWTVSWPCGVHPGFTELIESHCLHRWFQKLEGNTRKRVYHYMTTIREPIERFLSEWRHVQRGSTWKNQSHVCDGRPATPQELPPCFPGENWSGVSLQEFMKCPSNLAFNRQTRMLANLSLSDCYRRDSKLTQEERDTIMLRSAKHNLATFFDFFSLTEFQIESALLFQKTFGLHFNASSFQAHTTRGASTIETLSREQLEAVREKNKLDIELYRFARTLFFRKL